MRIQLKQNEIESAIKGFLDQQGIATGGKDINMVFTSGRKNNGLSVEVVIVDAVKPSLAEQFGMVSGEDTNTEYAPEPEQNIGATSGVVPTPAGSLFG